MSWNMETPKNGLNPSQDDAVAPSRPVYTAYAEYLGDLLQEDPKYFRCISLRDRLLSDKNKALPRGSLELFRFAVDGTLLYSSKHSLQKPLEDFKHTLIDSEESAAYQIVTLEISARNLPPVVIDILGLELDIGPRFWLHVENDYETRPTRWVCRDDFIQAGKNILAILDTSPKVPTKTALLLFRSGDPRPTDPGYESKHDEDKPSNVRQQPDLNSRVTSIRSRWIIDAVCNTNSYGPDNLLFGCLRVLLRLRISTASFGVFHARHWLLNGKHEVNFQTGEPDYGIDNATLRRQWQHFRNEVDEWRMILLWLPTFVEQNFNTADENLQKAYKLIQGTYEQYVRETELAEARMRDHLDMIDSAKGTEMAELSIYESKRVMLLTVLAFVFLPVSLATSIYGMNIQQINSSGHDIRAFIITAFGILLATLFVWASVSGILTFRRYRIKRLRGMFTAGERSFIDKLLLVGVSQNLLERWEQSRERVEVVEV